MAKGNVAVAHEDVFSGVKYGRLNGATELTTALSALIPNHLTVNDVIFVCIGTDRSSGDSLGPLVGTFLRGIGYGNVVGTLDDPTHAVNLAERVAGLPAGKTVIAIDACLGQSSSVGLLNAHKGAIKPGAGVGKTHLPEVGDYAISGVVNVGGFMEYFVLQNTRLSVVMKLAKDITSALVNIFPLSGESRVVETEVIAIEPVKKKRGRPRKVKEALVTV
ncbi:spore protease YyaC [Paenibacillus agricola]|uniref:Spore protease YyaC n=1 Tax=Paenibacillus agricola TaxID=2716264 RepID=A0ABX0J478_9BACL|nr:spore protease YyaC [Paenibacillus agricola]NHN31192.1 spore protease YyaC [Paenibacillus agricola]